MDLDDQPALASARASGGGGATPRVAQQRPASAPPPLSATPVGGDEWAAVSVLDQNELLELLLAKGVQVPSSVLGVVCSWIEALSSVKAPAVLRQKRVSPPKPCVDTLSLVLLPMVYCQSPGGFQAKLSLACERERD